MLARYLENFQYTTASLEIPPYRNVAALPCEIIMTESHLVNYVAEKRTRQRTEVRQGTTSVTQIYVMITDVIDFWLRN